jgi:LysR family transcriptional regulator, glycine cleavage system transcriptional activator
LNWKQICPGLGIELEADLPGPRMWHAHATLEAARSGEGVTLTNPFLLRDDIDTGRLALVGPPAQPGFAKLLGGYWVIATQSRWRQPNVETFRRWLGAEVSKAQQSMIAPPVI